MNSTFNSGLEAQIREWRTYIQRRSTVHHVDVDELEDHLRSQMTELGEAGLSGDESFLVAVKRIGNVNELAREFAREQSSRLWKQLVLSGDTVSDRSEYIGLFVVAAFALAAALVFKLPAAFGIDPFRESEQAAPQSELIFYLHNASILVLPFLIGFLAWRKGVPPRVLVLLAIPFVAAAILINTFPFETDSDTELLASFHLPVVLWLVTGLAYLGGAWRSDAPRMDFVRFTGECFIYYVLIALGGFVLCALTIGVFQAIDIDMVPFVTSWVLPCGAVGAVIVVAWLVEAKQSVIENMAPVLTSVFTPLFAVMLVGAIVGMVFTGNLIDAEREVLILLDVLLVVVVGLVLYALSARDPALGPSLMDAVQFVLVASALVIDVVALVAMISRIEEFGFSPNRSAGLGLNLILLANLLWFAWLQTNFLRGKRPFTDLERWQTTYIPVYGLWTAIVVIVFPPLFAFA